MAFLPQLTNDSQFYQFLQGSLFNAGYDSIEAFFRDEFSENTFPNTKWAELFPAAEENESGEYVQYTGVNTRPIMANYTSFDAEGQLIANDGFKVTSDQMPRMRLAMNFNEKSFRDGLKIQKLQGIPEYAKMYSSFYKDSQDLIAGIHTLRSFTALQIESTGKFLTDMTNNAGGVQGLLFNFLDGQANTNRRKTGEFGKKNAAKGKRKAWSDPDAYPIGDLRDLYWTYRKELVVPYKGVFRMSEDTYDLFINHPTTIAEVALAATGYVVDPANLSKVVLTDAQINEYLTNKLKLPAISVEDWYGVTQALNPKTKKRVKTPLQAFADGVVLLRPEGAVGEYQWQAPTTLFATSTEPMFITDGGRIGVQQEVFSKRKAMSFDAESTGIAVPRNIDYFLYLDVKTA